MGSPRPWNKLAIVLLICGAFLLLSGTIVNTLAPPMETTPWIQVPLCQTRSDVNTRTDVRFSSKALEGATETCPQPQFGLNESSLSSSGTAVTFDLPAGYFDSIGTDSEYFPVFLWSDSVSSLSFNATLSAAGTTLAVVPTSGVSGPKSGSSTSSRSSSISPSSSSSSSTSSNSNSYSPPSTSSSSTSSSYTSSSSFKSSSISNFKGSDDDGDDDDGISNARPVFFEAGRAAPMLQRRRQLLKGTSSSKSNGARSVSSSSSSQSGRSYYSRPRGGATSRFGARHSVLASRGYRYRKGSQAVDREDIVLVHYFGAYDSLWRPGGLGAAKPGSYLEGHSSGGSDCRNAFRGCERELNSSLTRVEFFETEGGAGGETLFAPPEVAASLTVRAWDVFWNEASLRVAAAPSSLGGSARGNFASAAPDFFVAFATDTRSGNAKTGGTLISCGFAVVICAALLMISTRIFCRPSATAPEQELGSADHADQQGQMMYPPPPALQGNGGAQPPAANISHLPPPPGYSGDGGNAMFHAQFNPPAQEPISQQQQPMHPHHHQQPMYHQPMFQPIPPPGQQQQQMPPQAYGSADPGAPPIKGGEQQQQQQQMPFP